MTSSPQLGALISGLDAKFSEVFSQKLSSVQPMHQLIARKLNKTEKRVHFKNDTGLGYPAYTPEGQDYVKREMLPGYELDLVSRKYTQQVRVTEETLDYNDFDQTVDAVGKMGISFGELLDLLAFNTLNVGFSTAETFTGGGITTYHSHMSDAKPLFSTVHPLKVAGGTYSNADANGAPLSDTSLNDALVAIRQQKADDGTAMPLLGRFVLVVPPALEKKAMELVGSELSPVSANNNINYFKGRMIDVVSSVYLSAARGGSDTAWYLIVPEAGSIILNVHKGLETRPVFQDEDNGDLVFNARMDASAGWKDWRYMYGSKGDSATYSS